MSHEDRLNKIKSLENCSPLEMSSKIIELELYDMESSQKIIDDIYEQFEDGEDVVDEVLLPCMFTVVDALFVRMGTGKNKNKLAESASQKGLSPSRFANEVKNFKYSNLEPTSFEQNGTLAMHHSEKKYTSVGLERNDKTPTVRIGDKETKGLNSYDRNSIDKSSRKAYKTKFYDKNKSGQCEHSGKVIHKTDKNPDKRLSKDSILARRSETDHNYSLKKGYDLLKTNPALHKEQKLSKGKDGTKLTQEQKDYNKTVKNDIADILNIEENLSESSHEINNAKSDMDYQEIKQKVKEGKLDSNLFTPEVLAKIKANEISAKKAISKKAYETVVDNLRHDKEIRKETAKAVGEGALKQTGELLIGDAIMMIVTPLTYEIYDSIKNGIDKGVQKNGIIEGVKFRMKRVFDFVLDKMKNLKMKVSDVIKKLISNFMNGLVNLFLGVYKVIAKVIISSIKSLIQAFKVIFGKDAKDRSPAEKADAILKIVGSLVTTAFGFLIESYIDNIFPDEISVPVSMIITGILTTLVTYQLNKMDIFAVKAEKRHAAIKSIFDQRIKDIDEAVELFDLHAIERLKQQHIMHDQISTSIEDALDKDDIEEVCDNLYELASFFKTDLEYSNSKEFVEYFDSAEAIVI